ncbi:MAG: uncharacterized protein KVP18_001942 [Porospora cf. gigantea A]|uniref:uncharacterized protein n=1 Tax=Porospora cf. gigantea A TaxID=2853593 RepID=UPI003559637E|nr:MAG: hypothetical protein KVP18_001942 [Porospora cf. gigantea A]
MSDASPKQRSHEKHQQQEPDPQSKPHEETLPALSICIMSVEYLYAEADTTFSVRIRLGDWDASTKPAPVDEEGCVIWKVINNLNCQIVYSILSSEILTEHKS